MLLLGLVLALQTEDAGRKAAATSLQEPEPLTHECAPPCDAEDDSEEDDPKTDESAARVQEIESELHDKEETDAINVEKLTGDTPTLQEEKLEADEAQEQGFKIGESLNPAIKAAEMVSQEGADESQAKADADEDDLVEVEEAADEADPLSPTSNAAHVPCDPTALVEEQKRVEPLAVEHEEADPKADFDKQVKLIHAQRDRMAKLEAELQKDEKKEKAEAQSHKHSRIWDELQHPGQHHRAPPAASSLLETEDGSVPRTMKKVEAEAARVEIKKILDRAKRQQEGFERMASDAEKAKTQARAAMAKLPKAQHDLEEARIHLEEERREHPRSSEIGNLRSDD
jgi:hypothetical protein